MSFEETSKLTIENSFSENDDEDLLSFAEQSSCSSVESLTSNKHLGTPCHNSSSNGDHKLHNSQCCQYGSIQSIELPEYENTTTDETATSEQSTGIKNTALRRVAIELSLYLNLLILFSKLIAYLRTLSLSVLAALTDSLLDVVSQLVLNYTEKHSTKSRSSALYPAGAARLEPVGVLTCAALMGMASFEILKESIESLIYNGSAAMQDHLQGGQNMGSVYGMAAIVFVKLALYVLCQYSRPSKVQMGPSIGNSTAKQSVRVSDPTLEALALDHWNDALSNGVAAAALFAALLSKDLWFLDPVGAIIISFYIIHSWYETGKEQIEQLTGKCAPDEFIDELRDLASNFDKRMVVDVVRAYHFGPKFLVELEVVLPKDTLLMESHDLGMELQYEIEGREEVEDRKSVV